MITNIYVNKLYLILFCIIFLSSFLSCNKTAKNTPEAVLKEVLTSQRPLKFYSTKTKSLIQKINSNGSISNAAALLPLLSQGAVVDILKKEKSFGTVTLSLRFTKHSIENMIGTVLIVKFIVEDGSWKIDRSKILSAYIDRDKGGERDYLKNLRSQYK